MAADRKTSVAVLGAGSWGTALASLLARHGYPTVLWGRDAEQVATIARDHENRRYLPGVPLPEATSTRQILPSPQITIDLPSGVQEYCG